MDINKKWNTVFSLNAKQIAVICVIGGNILFGLTFLLSKMVTLELADDFNTRSLKYISLIFLAILNLLGGVLVSTGLISLLFEISTIKSLIVQSYLTLMNKILSGNFDLSAYSNKRLNRIKEDIIIEKMKPLEMERECLTNSVYSLEKQLEKLLKTIYYENHIESIQITPNQGIFIKKVRTSYTLVNLFETPNSFKRKITFMEDGKYTSDEEKCKRVKFHKILVNGIDLTDEICRTISIEKHDDPFHKIYNYTVGFERGLQGCSIHKILMEYEYDVPITDINQSFTIPKACKKFTHTIQLLEGDIGNWMIGLDAFASFFYSDSELKEKFNLTNDSPTLAIVDFNDWILPGSGYVVTLRKRS